MTQPPAGHGFPPAMPVQLPAKGAVADPAALHGRDNAAHPAGEARLGIWATEWAQPVGAVQELLGLPGLRRRQTMLGTKMPLGVVGGALHRLGIRWLAKAGWRRGPFRGPFRLRMLAQAVEGWMFGHG